jgi:hypothetical protein
MTQLALTLLGLALALGVPALIALVAPLRWRLWAVGLWALAPLLILLGLAASEIASGKASVADLDKLVFGLLLIASVGLLPWLATCAVGFGLGALLRGRAPKAAVAEPAPPPAAVAKPLPEAAPMPAPVAHAPPVHGGPSLSPPGGWEAAHVGFANDDLVLDGLSVWSLEWRAEGDEQVMLAHPAHPTQHHAFDVFNIDDGARATRFAATELSNGVWGFYRWRVPADAPSGESADGALRYEHGPGAHLGGRDDNIAPLARLYEARSGALLFDGAAWQSSRIVPQTDGSLLLALEQRDLQTIFRIDPAAGVFRDLAVPDGARPLAELAAAAAAARAACDDPANAYLGRCVAPDGSLMVELQWVEWSNSHWVRSPRVTEIAMGRVLLDLWGTDWDASPSFPRPGAVRLGFRRYHVGGHAEAEIDLAPERYILIESSGSTSGPLDKLPQALEQASRRTAASPRPLSAPRRPAARSWLVALLILGGALAAIAAATWITMRLEGERPRQRLDTIPAMPGPLRPEDRPSFRP